MRIFNRRLAGLHTAFLLPGSGALLGRPARWMAAMALATGALATPAHADDTLIASATLQVSGLQYRLVDLDPNDGITPWVNFTGATNTQVELREPNSPDIKQTFPGLFPAPFTVTSASGLAQVQRSNDGFTVHNALRRSDLDNAASWPTQPDVFLAQRAALLGIEGAAAAFSLSPHTRLVIEGQLTPSVTLDMSSLTDHGLIQNPAGPINGLHGRSTLYLFYSAYDEGGLLPMEEGSGHLSVQQDVTATGAGLEELEDVMPAALSFGLSNTLGIPLQGRVAWGASLYTDVSGTVPEPQTWALAMAGLLVVPAARRAQKRQC